MLVAVSGIAQLATGLLQDMGAPALQATLLTVPLVVFALWHGSLVYGWRNMLVFAAICVLVINVIENVSIVTGYPFGFYRYSDRLGPRLFLVPLIIGPAYFGVGYLAWMLARLMLGDAHAPQSRRATWEVPLIAAFAMVAWNLSFDPAVSTVHKAWSWQVGGCYFGVPITNFFAWYLTSYLFFLLYALHLDHVAKGEVSGKPASPEYWCQPVVLYGTLWAMAIVGALSTTTTTEKVTDQAGAVWSIRQIYAACALVSTFTMGAFTVLALIKVARLRPANGAPAGHLS
jgi:putative membrane protein